MSEIDGKPWLSIVTVVKDDPTGFDRTRESVLNQSLENYEWVVVDSSHLGLVVPEANVYTWIAPAGVFPAMNVGLRLCTGNRVFFLNAGDTLNLKTTLLDIERACSILDDSTVVFGDVSFISEDGLKSVTPPPFDFQLEQARLFAAGRFPPQRPKCPRRTRGLRTRQQPSREAASAGRGPPVPPRYQRRKRS